MGREMDIGTPPTPETLREVLEDIFGTEVTNIRNLSEEQILKLKGIKTALELILGQEVEV